MGYTSYWRVPKELDQTTWEKFVEDVKKLRFALPEKTDTAGGYHKDDPLVLKGGMGEGEPQITNEIIWFNGDASKDLDHETFHLKRVFKPESWKEPDNKGRYFNFCKTARKPYDLMVCLTLIALKYHFKSKVEVSSDGDNDDWKPAVELFEKTLNIKAPKQFKVKEKVSEEE